MILNQLRIWAAAGIVVLTWAGSAASTNEPAAETTITCTNPASGASWQIQIDFAKRTVDSNPARISNTEITWHDAKDGRNYTLDRVSGALTVVGASSTGGYFFFDRCMLRNSG